MSVASFARSQWKNTAISRDNFQIALLLSLHAAQTTLGSTAAGEVVS